MSADEYQHQREQHDIFTSCPQCHEWLWNEDTEQFDTTCPACGWQDIINDPLPEAIEQAMIYLQNLREKVDFGIKLSANEQQLLAQAVVYAQENQK